MRRTIPRYIDRVLTRLRNVIREQGFTQLEVQEALGWGLSYISQLLTQQKALRVEQVLAILKVVGVDPGEFFAEVFGRKSAPFGRRRRVQAPRNAAALREIRTDYETLVKALTRKELIKVSELEAYVYKARAIGDRQTPM